MGCTSSKDVDLNLQEIERLKEELKLKELKFHEQQNLLRFKVEVLVNMLSVEEERNISNTKRLEILKYLLYSQGITESKLNQLLTEKLDPDSYIEIQERLTQSLAKVEETQNDQNSSENKQIKRKKSSQIELIDLSNAITSMKEEFSNFSNDILHCFADEEGKILPSINVNLFIKQLFLTTKNISKKDLNILALRFQDGYGNVNIVEFLDFFTTPEHVRKARNASNAVRMSLNLLTVDINDKESSELQDELNIEDYEFIRTHMTDKLDKGARRVLSMWKFVKSPIISTLKINEETESSRHIVDTKWFMATLLDICGSSSIPLQKAVDKGQCIIKEDSKKKLFNSLNGSLNSLNNTLQSNNPSSPSKSTSNKNVIEIEYLEEEDLLALTERFEIGNYIDSYYFVKYFDELYEKLKNNPKYLSLEKDTLGVSPFITSSEWIPLKESSQILKTLKEKRLSTPLPTPVPPTPPAPVLLPQPTPVKSPPPPTPVKPKRQAPLRIQTPIDEKSSDEDELPTIKQDTSFVSPEKMRSRQLINFDDDDDDDEPVVRRKGRVGKLIKREEKGFDKEIVEDDEEDEYDVIKK